MCPGPGPTGARTAPVPARKRAAHGPWHSHRPTPAARRCRVGEPRRCSSLERLEGPSRRANRQPACLRSSEAKTCSLLQPSEYFLTVSPAESAAVALFAFYRRPFLSPEELASGLGLHYNTVLRAIRRGDLPCIECGRRKDGTRCKPYRVCLEHVTVWFAQNRDVPSDDEPQPEQTAALKRPDDAAGNSARRATSRRKRVNVVGLSTL